MDSHRFFLNFQGPAGGHKEPEPGGVHQAGREPEVPPPQVRHHPQARDQGLFFEKKKKTYCSPTMHTTT